MEIIKQFERKLICRLSSILLINEDFISQLIWPEGIDRFVCIFDKSVEREWDILSNIKSVDRVWMIYSMTKVRTEIIEEGSSKMFVETKLPDIKELELLFSETRREYYRSLNRDLTERQVIENQDFIEKVLPRCRRVCLQKNGKPIALLMMVEAKDYEGKPVDWVPWVWIEKNITFEEREMVHRRFWEWLVDGELERVQCSVASSNLRSQKFFRKIGFKPECLHILKEKH